MSIHERLKSYIDANGLKLNFVAAKADIPEKKFYRLLNGETKITADEFERICKNGLSVDPAIFFEQNFSEIENTN